VCFPDTILDCDGSSVPEWIHIVQVNVGLQTYGITLSFRYDYGARRLRLRDYYTTIDFYNAGLNRIFFML
jgi:hypothetical protein